MLLLAFVLLEGTTNEEALFYFIVRSVGHRPRHIIGRRGRHRAKLPLLDGPGLTKYDGDVLRSML
jgi:hypothetical protein